MQASRSMSDAGNIADMNRNGIADSVDMCMMIDHWQTYEPYCDIAPVPFGDGIVDIEDMVVFMSYWEKENIPEVQEEEP